MWSESSILVLYLQVAQSESEKKLKKEDKKKELQELNELFKPVVAAQKISKGMTNWCHLCFLIHTIS